MQFNGNSDGQDIVSSIGDATGINTTVEIKQITRAVNRAGRIIWSWIFESYGGWSYDDSNNTDLPFARTDLVSGQNKYTLPSEALSVQSVEVLNEGGEWSKVMPLPLSYIEQGRSEEEFQDSDGIPQYYSLVSNVIKLYPKPNQSVSNGFRVRIDRGSVAFTSNDTTKSPGFASEFHDAISDGASYFIARNKKLGQLELLFRDWSNWEKEIKEYYSQRFAELYPKELKNGDYTNNVT